MGGIYEIGSRGERLLAEYLTARGRTVKASDRKTFDLVVDGKYAEVKTSDAPYSRLGFIGLTDAQFRELKSGTPFTIFVVCNARQPDQLEVIEFDATELLKQEPKVECTYYWYRSHLDKCRAPVLSTDNSQTSAPPSRPSPKEQVILREPRAAGEITVHIRRLAATADADLYVRLENRDVERLGVPDRQLVSLILADGPTISGTLRSSGGSSWIAPAPGSSNATVSALLRAAGLEHGSDVKATVTTH